MPPLHGLPVELLPSGRFQRTLAPRAVRTTRTPRPQARTPSDLASHVESWQQWSTSHSVPVSPCSVALAGSAALVELLGKRYEAELQEFHRKTSTSIDPVLFGVLADIGELPFLKAIVRRPPGGARLESNSQRLPAMGHLLFGQSASDTFLFGQQARLEGNDKAQLMNAYRDFEKLVKEVKTINNTGERKAASHLRCTAFDQTSIEQLAKNRWYEDSLKCLLQYAASKGWIRTEHQSAAKPLLLAFHLMNVAAWMVAFCRPPATLPADREYTDYLHSRLELNVMPQLVPDEGTQANPKHQLGIVVTTLPRQPESEQIPTALVTLPLIGIMGPTLTPSQRTSIVSAGLDWSCCVVDDEGTEPDEAILFGPLARVNVRPSPTLSARMRPLV
ncbi:hypothetical protein JCM5350_005458 [Sporobolomyces pararoseus]